MVQANDKMGGKKDPGQWLHIDDFSPGCYDPSNQSTFSPVTNQPLGAADINNTFCCSVIKGGSLGPLPSVVGGLELSAYGGLQGGAPLAVLTGFIITPQLNDGSYEIIVILEMDDGTTHYVVAASYEPGGSVNLISGPTNNSDTTPGYFGAPYPAFTRANADGSSGPPPPGPVLIFPGSVATDASGSNGHLWLYPELDDPTSYTAQDLIVSGSSITGQVITYGDRIICIVGVDYDWPAGGGINTNENFNYTDPPESSEYGNQQTIMSPEEPWGYGAWGTMSVGELILIKKYGGAVMLNGDINVPSSIIPLPGVQSTGNFVGRAAMTPIGLIYCSENQGAWLWDGGNTAQKISQAIADNFFDLENNVIESNNYGFFVEHWQKWIMFSGNIWLDTDTQSWWNIFPKKGISIGSLTGTDFFWYCLTRNGNQLLAAPLTMDSDSDVVFSTLDNTNTSDTYQWQSLPIHVTQQGDAQRVVDIRQIIVRCSDPTGSGNCTLTASLPNGSWSDTSSAADTPIGSDPTIVRFNVGMGAQGLTDIVIRILAENPTPGPAPIIESIDIEYKVRAPEAVAN
jgi:hypothetical protein